MWKIWVVASTIHSESGQVDGKKIKSEDFIREGKNIGKANETTAGDQSVLEATARWTKKKKKGYVERQDDAAEGKTSSLVDGGFVPMTARVYQDHKKHIKFPCAVQPKLDGIRCTVKNGKLFTRSRKSITSVPHIEKFIHDNSLMGWLLDGELYNHDYKDDFEKITHLVKRPDPAKGHEKVQYHVYDLNFDYPFETRLREMDEWAPFLEEDKNCPIKMVETRIAKDEAELSKIYEDFMEQGYEGAMVRNLNSPYENKKSKHLQKYKEFMDDEFKIIGAEEGRGKLTGCVAKFICEIPKGFDEHGYRTFKATPSDALGKQEFKKKMFDNPSIWKGHWVTVKFQNYTKKTVVPRFGNAIRFRDDKDF